MSLWVKSEEFDAANAAVYTENRRDEEHSLAANLAGVDLVYTLGQLASASSALFGSDTLTDGIRSTADKLELHCSTLINVNQELSDLRFDISHARSLLSQASPLPARRLHNTMLEEIRAAKEGAVSKQHEEAVQDRRFEAARRLLVRAKALLQRPSVRSFENTKNVQLRLESSLKVELSQLAEDITVELRCMEKEINANDLAMRNAQIKMIQKSCDAVDLALVYYGIKFAATTGKRKRGHKDDGSDSVGQEMEHTVMGDAEQTGPMSYGNGSVPGDRTVKRVRRQIRSEKIDKK